MKKLLCFIFVLASIFLIIILIVKCDYREVQLKYITKIRVDPQTDAYFKQPYSWYNLHGDQVKDFIEKSLCYKCIDEELFKERAAGNQALYSGSQRYNEIINAHYYDVKWDDVIKFEERERYFIGVGCEIEKINYYYHSRFFNWVNESSVFYFDEVKLKPLENKRIVIIYKGDVSLIWNGEGT